MCQYGRQRRYTRSIVRPRTGLVQSSAEQCIPCTLDLEAERRRRRDFERHKTSGHKTRDRQRILNRPSGEKRTLDRVSDHGSFCFSGGTFAWDLTGGQIAQKESSQSDGMSCGDDDIGTETELHLYYAPEDSEMKYGFDVYNGLIEEPPEIEGCDHTKPWRDLSVPQRMWRVNAYVKYVARNQDLRGPSQEQRVPCSSKKCVLSPSARIDIPPRTRHGTFLKCSLPSCTMKIHYCAICDKPVAKATFDQRHADKSKHKKANRQKERRKEERRMKVNQKRSLSIRQKDVANMKKRQKEAKRGSLKDLDVFVNGENIRIGSFDSEEKKKLAEQIFWKIHGATIAELKEGTVSIEAARDVSVAIANDNAARAAFSRGYWGALQEFLGRKVREHLGVSMTSDELQSVFPAETGFAGQAQYSKEDYYFLRNLMLLLDEGKEGLVWSAHGGSFSIISPLTLSSDCWDGRFAEAMDALWCSTISDLEQKLSQLAFNNFGDQKEKWGHPHFRRGHYYLLTPPSSSIASCPSSPIDSGDHANEPIGRETK